MNLNIDLIDFFGFEPAIWHSKITPKNKRIIWKGIINNKIKLSSWSKIIFISAV